MACFKQRETIGSQHEGCVASEGHKMNLRGHDMMYRSGKKIVYYLRVKAGSFVICLICVCA